MRFNFLACLISYLSISARDFKPDKKTAALFIKHYINATAFKIIQLDARKGVLGQLAIPTGNAPRLNFSVPECFSKELEYWWKGFAISDFLNFNMTCSILANLCLKDGSIGCYGSYSRQPSCRRWLNRVFQGRYLQSLSINYL